ncbi:MAG: hypothetical protein PHD88_09740 [Firmicutes bacterium]|nr:hypothetical protein [Bacillota bacterium]MDD4694643.1 hypothetical protein [Bacillota bacterium]
MRKFFPLFLCLVVLSGMVFAVDFSWDDNSNLEDGIKVHFAKNIGYINDFEGRTTDFYRDKDNPPEAGVRALNLPSWSQQAEVTLKAKAYIPCYLGLTVFGNNGGAAVESFGPGSQSGTWNGSIWYMLFDNEIGGFIDENWEFLARGKNAEIRPFPKNDLDFAYNAFIEACDTFHTVVYSNDAYTYEVEAGALKYANENAGVKDLPLDMQSQFAWAMDPYALAEDVIGSRELDSLTYNDPIETTFTTNKSVNFGSMPYCTFTVVKHRFRVPYEMTVRHGEYSGQVTFRAYTI